jgi:hypothetical protein
MSRIQINYYHPITAKTTKATKISTAALILATFALMTIGVVP